MSRRSDASIAAFSVAIVLVVVALPFVSARYPAMVDLPFHAAQTSTLRHYFDPSFHFQEQFELRPLAVPYLLMYALGALLMLVFPPLVAVKLASAAMLLLLPLGLAILLRGLRKSALFGVAGAAVAWLPLTHWGFLSFIGALGLFAAVVGLALLVVERPTRGRRLAFGAALVLLFFAHVFRFPFAVAAAGAAVLVVRPRRALALVLPALPALALFAAWLLVRPTSLRADPGRMTPHFDRLAEIPSTLSGTFSDPAEPRALLAALALVVAAGLVAFVARAFERRGRASYRFERVFAAKRGVVLFVAIGISAALFFVLPMRIGDWWYVYPREATSVAFLALALLPRLPRARTTKVLALGLAGAGALAPSVLAARNYAAFGRATEDFAVIVEHLPRAPKLLYLVFDHSGATRQVSAFTHLPAWVQAERGGWLSFHFEKFGASPLVYRPRDGREDVVPPPTPPCWEATPEKFDLGERGAFFDWFLVRKADSPAALFEADSTILLEAHVGTWWLFRRAEPGAPSEPAPEALAPGQERASSKL